MKEPLKFGDLPKDEMIDAIKYARKSLNDERKAYKFVLDQISEGSELASTFVYMALMEDMVRFIASLGLISDNKEILFKVYRASKMRVRVLNRLIKIRYGLEVEE